MGKYRQDDEHRKLPTDTKWVGEGDWAKSLGNPIGNDLDGGKKFIEKKLEAVRNKSKKWFGLYTAKYQGRNLITQAMYFGSLRYWNYTLYQNKNTRMAIQADAERLRWAKDPDLENNARYRRFVSKTTAIGPRSKGGMSNMDWSIHYEAYTSQWITRYVSQPGDNAWKLLLDFLLFRDKKGKDTMPGDHKRAFLTANLTPLQKKRYYIGFQKVQFT